MAETKMKQQAEGGENVVAAKKRTQAKPKPAAAAAKPQQQESVAKETVQHEDAGDVEEQVASTNAAPRRRRRRNYNNRNREGAGVASSDDAAAEATGDVDAEQGAEHSQPQTNQRCTVYVANVNPETDSDTLTNVFAHFGEIVNFRLISRTDSPSIAFLTFAEPEIAASVIEHMDKTVLQNYELKVEAARPQRSRYGRGGYRGRGRMQNRRSGTQINEDTVFSNKTLYIANLPFSCKSETLSDLFTNPPSQVDENGNERHIRPFDIVSAHVVNRNGYSKGFGFVEIRVTETADGDVNNEEHQRAITEMTGVKMGNRNVIVKAAVSELSYEERQAKLEEGAEN